jgi:hypothetical protein
LNSRPGTRVPLPDSREEGANREAREDKEARRARLPLPDSREEGANKEAPLPREEGANPLPPPPLPLPLPKEPRPPN